jgi:hypothetical protein
MATKGIKHYMKKAWGNAKGRAKKDLANVKAAIGEVPVGVKPLKADSRMKLKDVELNRIKDIGK